MVLQQFFFFFFPLRPFACQTLEILFYLDATLFYNLHFYNHQQTILFTMQNLYH